jgi:signal transduction histidine kinase/CheY-like chemotaxis protein
MAETEFLKHIQTRGKYAYNVKVRYVHRDGHLINVLTRANAVEWLDDGRPWRVIGSHSDISKELNYDAILTKYKFVSRMSHEIRTPLSVIISTVDTLDMDLESLSDNVTILKKSSRQLLRISNNVLSLSQLENRQAIPITYIKVNLADEVRAIISDLRESCVAGMKLRIIEDADLPNPMYCDIGKVRQIVTNLLANAIKFSPQGGVIEVVIDCADVTDTDVHVTINVRDQGIGIPEDKWRSIFLEFSQGSNSVDGAGLGLYISKCLAEIINGRVRVVRSVIDKGTDIELTFRAKLSYDKSSSDMEKVTYTKSQYLCSAVFNRVLIVDDIELMRHVLSKQMERTAQCNDIIYATNGLEAVEIFTRNEGGFDIIFMDCLMPIMDGFTASVKINEWLEEHNKPPVPIVAVTASISENIQMECLDAGMHYVVYKPYSRSDIANVIKKIVHNKRACSDGSEEEYPRNTRSVSMMARGDDDDE